MRMRVTMLLKWIVWSVYLFSYPKVNLKSCLLNESFVRVWSSMFRICAEDLNEIESKESQRIIMRVEVYFMCWNSEVKIHELVQDCILKILIIITIQFSENVIRNFNVLKNETRTRLFQFAAAPAKTSSKERWWMKIRLDRSFSVVDFCNLVFLDKTVVIICFIVECYWKICIFECVKLLNNLIDINQNF